MTTAEYGEVFTPENDTDKGVTMTKTDANLHSETEALEAARWLITLVDDSDEQWHPEFIDGPSVDPVNGEIAYYQGSSAEHGNGITVPWWTEEDPVEAEYLNPFGWATVYYDGFEEIS